MLNVKRRCRFNVNVCDESYLNNNDNNINNNHINSKNVDYAEKLCSQHKKHSCTSAEVCSIVFLVPHMASITNQLYI